MSKKAELLVRAFLRQLDILGYNAIIIKTDKINTSTLRKKGIK